MKTITLFALLCLLVSSSFAQEKGTIRAYVEGAYFTPREVYDYPTKNGFSTGGGISYEFPILKKVSGSLGLGYRFKFNRRYQSYPQYSGTYGGYGSGYSPYGYGYLPGVEGANGYFAYTTPGEWQDMPQHYLVIPADIKYHIKDYLFLQAGMEASWLLNYDQVDEKPEFSWSLGAGSKLGDLEWSVSYMRGTREQAMYNYVEDPIELLKNQHYRNSMILLKLSYPLWKR